MPNVRTASGWTNNTVGSQWCRLLKTTRNPGAGFISGGECVIMEKVVKSLLLAWLIGISLIVDLVGCGSQSERLVGYSLLETWGCILQ